MREDGDGDYTIVCNRGRRGFTTIDKNIKITEAKLTKLAEMPYFVSHPQAIKAGKKLLSRIRADLIILLARPDFALAFFYRGTAKGYLDDKEGLFSDFEKAESLGLDFEKIKNDYNKRGAQTAEPKKPPQLKSKKITKEEIEFINSLNPLEGMVFGKTFNLESYDHYLKIVVRNPKLSVFLKGWTNRVASRNYADPK